MASLDTLLGGLSSQEFFDNYYEKAVLYVPGAISRYNEVLTAAEISDYLDRDDTFYPAIRLVKKGKELPQNDYTLSNVPIGHQKKNGLIHPEKMMRLFNNGATIVIQGGQRYFTGVKALAKNLSDIFASPIQANLYITPDKSIGFNPHWDTHDVFVLQIEGSKTWHLYDFEVKLPTKSQPFKGQPLKAEKTQTLQLKAGDFLYVPRGYVHDAIADDGVSAHITIGVLAFTWERFFKEALTQLQDHEAFRKRVPLKAENFHDLLQEKIRELQGMLPNLDYDKPAELLDGIKKERQPPGYRHFWQSLLLKNDIQATTEVARNLGFDTAVSADDDTVHIIHNGRKVSLPLHSKAAVEFIFDHEYFTPMDLPGNLDEKSKIFLVKKLVEEGLLYCRPR